MSETETAYCRFCAQSKAYGKLIDLQSDDERRRKVLEKLFRLSLEILHFNSPHDVLPKTVCFPCIEALDKAFEFISNVETSQSELSTLGVFNVKQEIYDEITISPEEICPRPVKKEVEIEVYIDVAHNTVKEENYNETEVQTDNSSSEHSLLKEDLVIIKLEKETSESGGVEKTIPVENKVDIKTKKQKAVNLKKNLQVDSQGSWKDYNWLCSFCDTMFPSIEELKQHSMQSHSSCNPFRCTDCRMRKLRLDSFVTHVKQHRNSLRLSCYRCLKTFSRQYDAQMHKKEHINSEFICPGCNETFATEEECKQHCNKYKKDKKTREVPPEQLTEDLKCVFCQKQFGYKGVLTTHLLTQHGEQKRDHTCEKCGKCFANKANLAAHSSLHDDIKPYTCNICSRSFRLRAQLSRHIGSHDTKKPFTCETCGRCFRLKKQLSAHSIVHAEKSPHICSYCQKGFKHKSTFIQHVRLHTGERPYKCHLCTKEYTNWPNYNKHMKKNHGMNMAKKQQSLDLTTAKSNGAVDLTMANRNYFVPNPRGRPKKIISVRNIIPSHEIKTEVT